MALIVVIYVCLFIPGKTTYHAWKKWQSLVLYVDVAIKSYAISPQTGSTFDGFINCTLERFSGLFVFIKKGLAY